VAELLGLFADHVGTAEFEPLSTTGVPLAVRQDWQDVLAAAASLGTTTVWVALHGLGVEHDRQVNRPGAYAETCLAIQRVHAAGLRAGCNVFLNHGHRRPGRAAAGGAGAAAGRPDGLGAGDLGLPLVCRPSLELHTGVAVRYRERHGNLRADGAQAVLSRALEQGGRSVDAVWFRPDPLPSIGELAARHGGRTGQGVHFTETSVRYLWLDRAQRRAAAVVNSRPRHE
jgi:hypothetical protein